MSISIKITIKDDDGTEYTLADLIKLAKAIEKFNADEAKVEANEQKQLFKCYAITNPLPLKGGGAWEPDEIEYNRWKQDFPGVNVQMEFEKMRLWLNANPRNLKTAKGIKTFVRKWLGRAFTDLADRVEPDRPKPKPTPTITVDNMRFDLRRTRGSHVNDWTDEQVVAEYNRGGNGIHAKH